MTIIVRSMYNFVNCLQFDIRYEKVERPAPVGGALVINIFLMPFLVTSKSTKFLNITNVELLIN